MGNFIVASDEWSPSHTPADVVCIGNVAQCSLLLPTLGAKGYKVTAIDVARRQLPVSAAEVVVVDVTTMGIESLSVVRKISASLALRNPHGRIVCISSVSRNSRFVLNLEKCGGRYVRIADSQMLIEAVDIAVAKARLAAASRPRFVIVHQFSQGVCAPGEEIASVHLDDDRQLPQLSLVLAQRFVVDFLALNRGIAMDCLQIASGIGAGWFYRDHGVNSGMRQTKKIRPATVKVLAQRIREAMNAGFVRAGLQFNAYDVLRGIPTEGSKMILYRLDAGVLWLHRGEGMKCWIRESQR